MQLRRLLGFVFTLVIWICPVAFAGTFSDAEQLYRQGAYNEARDAAAQLKTADGYALAARAHLTAIDLSDHSARSIEDIEIGIALAEKALAMDPANVSGYIQMSVGIGLKSRLFNKLKAHFGGYGKLTKGYMDTALAIEPDNPWVLTLSGAWHIEIINRGGRTLAESTYGASEEVGLAMLDRAIELAPDNPIFLYQYGLQLVAYDPVRFHDKAIGLLERASALDATSHVEQVSKDRADDLLSILSKGQHRKARKLAVVYQGIKAA